MFLSFSFWYECLGQSQNINKRSVVCLHRSTIAHLYHSLISVSWQEKKMNTYIEVHNNSLEFSECKLINQKYTRTLKARLRYFLKDVISSVNSLQVPFFPCIRYLIKVLLTNIFKCFITYQEYFKVFLICLSVALRGLSISKSKLPQNCYFMKTKQN